MITFLDLILQDEFRNFVSHRLAEVVRAPQYIFSTSFPLLYKYRPLSKYAVDDIIDGRVTATSIGDFNDLFDGAMHRYGTQEECLNAAEEKWTEFEKHRIAAGLPEGLLKHDYYVETYTEHFKTESRLKFRELDYLGTYVCCFSSKCDSTLMWAHYANSNTGICVEYDFTSPAANAMQKKLLFPVAYSREPVDLRDLLNDEKGEVYQYPLDAAVLCAALNKAEIWSYENEWRMVLVLATAKEKERRLSIFAPSPTSILFGYHFLKPFFYYDFKNKRENEDAAAKIRETVRLLNYIKQQKLSVSVMTPSIGGYNLVKKAVDIDALRDLIYRYFKDGDPENMRYYYVVHDELMDLIEGEQ